MKMNFFKLRNVALATAFLLTTTSVTVVNATDKVPATVELRFVGKQNNNPVFELSLPKSEKNSGYWVTVLNAEGEVLYSESLTAGNKRFLLNEGDLQGEALRFEVTGKTDKKTVTYDVNHFTREIAQTTTTKVKY